MTKTNELIAKIEKQLCEADPKPEITLPWKVVETPLGFSVYDSAQHLIAAHLTKELAQFIAQSPETIRKLILMLKVAMTGLEHIDNECRKERIAWGIASDAIVDVHDVAAGGEK